MQAHLYLHELQQSRSRENCASSPVESYFGAMNFAGPAGLCLEKLDEVSDDVLAGSIFNLIQDSLQRQSETRRIVKQQQACVFSMLFTLMMSPSFDVTSSCNGQARTGDEYHSLPRALSLLLKRSASLNTNRPRARSSITSVTCKRSLRLLRPCQLTSG